MTVITVKADKVTKNDTYVKVGNSVLNVCINFQSFLKGLYFKQVSLFCHHKRNKNMITIYNI